MKIRSRDEQQQDALRLLDQNSTAANKSKKRGALGQLTGDDKTQDGITVDVPLGRSIGQQLDPSVFEAERRARVEDIKKRVQSGTYTLPSSEEVAQKLSEEIGFEILTSGEKQSGNGV